MGRGDAGRHPRLDRREVFGRQRAGQVEVVVEAVVDGRADAQLRAREELEHGLGHDVRGGVAHGVDRGVRARVEQLVGRAAFGRLERLLDLDYRFVAHDLPPLETRNPSSMQDEGPMPPAVPPAFASPAGAGRALSWPR